MNFREIQRSDDTGASCAPAAEKTVADAAGIAAEIEAMRRLAVDVSRAWIAPESGVELIEQQRR
jgi:hypothetical protein